MISIEHDFCQSYCSFDPRPSDIVVASVCVCVCVSYAKTRRLFQIEHTKFSKACKRPWLKSLLFCRQIKLWNQILPRFVLVCANIHQVSNMGYTSLNDKYIFVLLRSLLILSFIDRDLQFHFQFWNLFFYQIFNLCRFCIAFSETITCKY